MNKRDMFLDKLVWLDRRGDFQDGKCALCLMTSKHISYLTFLLVYLLPIPIDSLYRCVECFEGSLKCGRCISGVHKLNPFHQIQVLSCLCLYAFHGLTCSRGGREVFLRKVVSEKLGMSSSLDIPLKILVPTQNVTLECSQFSTSTASTWSTSCSVAAAT